MDTETPLSTKSVFFQIAGTLLCGLTVCVFSLNGVLRSLAGNWPETRTGNALLGIAAIPDTIYEALPGGKYFLLELLVRWALLSLAVFVCLLLLNSIRHQTLNLFVSGAGGLLLGLFVLTWVSLFIFLLGIVLICVVWLFGILQWILMAVLSFFLWPPILFTLAALGSVVGVVAVIALIRNLSLEQIFAWLKQVFALLTARTLIFVGGLAAAAALAWFVLIPLWIEYVAPLLALIAAWLKEYVAPVIAWILSAVVTLVLALLIMAAVVFVLLLLGRQFVDQLASARVCGRDMYGAFSAGFCVGAAAGLTLLVCSANGDYRAIVNAAWAGTSPVFADVDIVAAVYTLMPGSAEALLQSLFVKASVPIFDSALIVVTLLLANCSLLMGLVSGASVEPLRRLLTFDRMPAVFKLMFGVFVAFIAVAADSVANQDS